MKKIPLYVRFICLYVIMSGCFTFTCMLLPFKYDLHNISLNYRSIIGLCGTDALMKGCSMQMNLQRYFIARYKNVHTDQVVEL